MPSLLPGSHFCLICWPGIVKRRIRTICRKTTYSLCPLNSYFDSAGPESIGTVATTGLLNAMALGVPARIQYLCGGSGMLFECGTVELLRCCRYMFG